MGGEVAVDVLGERHVALDDMTAGELRHNHVAVVRPAADFDGNTPPERRTPSRS